MMKVNKIYIVEVTLTTYWLNVLTFKQETYILGLKKINQIIGKNIKFPLYERQIKISIKSIYKLYSKKKFGKIIPQEIKKLVPLF